MAPQPGELWQLASGGPPMVVARPEKNPFGEDGFLCFWSVQGAARREVFPEEVLRPYKPEKS
jgi:uncharacterized protein YodC (DUF2158 family)